MSVTTGFIYGGRSGVSGKGKTKGKLGSGRETKSVKGEQNNIRKGVTEIVRYVREYLRT